MLLKCYNIPLGVLRIFASGQEREIEVTDVTAYRQDRLLNYSSLAEEQMGNNYANISSLRHLSGLKYSIPVPGLFSMFGRKV